MKVVYIPSKDELVLEIYPRKGRPNKKLNHFKLWWDDGTIRAIAITSFMEEWEEFKKNLNMIQLGGIWKGVRITGEDIRETRRILLKELEEKW